MTIDKLEEVRAHFEARRGELFARWREQVRADNSLPESRLWFSDEELEDHLPGLFQEMINALGGMRVSEEEIEQRGARHGHARRVRGYRAAQVAWEFAIFRQLLRQTLEELAAAQPSDILYGARELLMHIVDRSEFSSIEQFVREANLERDAARDELRAANEQKDRFLAVLSHELRNPLAAIRTALYILHKEVIDEVQRQRALDVVERQTASQIRLIDDLLDVNRISRGKIELERKPLDLRKAIQNAVEPYLPEFEAKGIGFKYLRPDYPLRVSGDGFRIEQIISNLLANALKFTSSGGTIQISAERETGQFVVRVRDTGAGLDRAMLDRLFQLFAQGEAGNRTGLGVGLWLARKLTELHGGTIEAASDGLDKGTELTLRLPSLAEEAEPSKDAVMPCVLLVEDNPDQREMMLLALADEPVQVVGAKDVADAIARTSENAFDIFILDLDLPDGSGFQLAREILQNHRGERPFLIAATGFGRPEDAVRASEAGFDRHLVKPVDIELLKQLIRLRLNR